MFEEIFLHKKASPEKLINYGFTEKSGIYALTTDILGGDFVLTVTISGQAVDTALTEKDTGEEYTLYKTPAQGTFVGEIREAVAEVLKDIAEKCFKTSIFRQEQTLRLTDYVSEKHGDELEFLWDSLPEAAIWRRKDTGKWYGIIMTVTKNKLCGTSPEKVEILDLRAPRGEMESLLQNEGFYGGWHMNKKSWFTVILDDSVADDKLHLLVERSYLLAVK